MVALLQQPGTNSWNGIGTFFSVKKFRNGPGSNEF
jgi:hypothetical protein